MAQEAGLAGGGGLGWGAEHAEGGAGGFGEGLQRGEGARGEVEVGFEVRADEGADGVGVAHVGGDGGAGGLDAGGVGPRGGGAEHVVLGDVVEGDVVWAAVFDEDLAEGFVAERGIREEEERLGLVGCCRGMIRRSR